MSERKPFLNKDDPPVEQRQEFTVVGGLLTLLLLFGVLPLAVWLISLVWSSLTS